MKFISSLDFHPIRSKPSFKCCLNHRLKKSTQGMCILAIWQNGVGKDKSQLGKIPEHLAYTLALCLFVIGVRDEITIARTSHSLAWLRHNPFSQHSSRLLRAPSNALSLQLCSHVTQHCVVAVICVCVCLCMNEAVVSDLNSAFDC